jgi:hypothetical protein
MNCPIGLHYVILDSEVFLLNRTIKNWNQLPAEALGTSLVNLKFLDKDLGKQL